MSNEINPMAFFQEPSVADLRLLACPGAEELTKLIDQHLVEWAKSAGVEKDSFIIPCSALRGLTQGSLGQCAIVDDAHLSNISARYYCNKKNPKGVSAEFIRVFLSTVVGQTLGDFKPGQVQQKLQHKTLLICLFRGN